MPAFSDGGCTHSTPPAASARPTLAHSLHVIEVAWSYLCRRARLAIRSCCRDGLLLHARLWTHVHVVLAARGKGVARGGPDHEQQQEEQVKKEGSAKEAQRQQQFQYGLLHDTQNKDPAQLAQELGAAVGRGARPRSLAGHVGTRRGVAEECMREQL